MKRFIRQLTPNTLKNKFILAFTLLIILPYMLLNIYSFREVERVLKENVSNQAQDQIASMNRTLEDLMGMTFRSTILIKQDPTIAEILKSPDSFSLLDRHNLMSSKLESINNSFFLSSPPIYYTILDMHGNVYTSYQTRVKNDYTKLTQEEWYLDLMNHASFYRWNITENNFVHIDLSKSNHLLTVDAKLLNGKNQKFGVARVSIDFNRWFNSLMKGLPENQDYFIIMDNGEVLVQSENSSPIDEQTLTILKTQSIKDGYFIDEDNHFIINYNYIESLGWYMINRIPIEIMFNEVDEIKNKYIIQSLVLITLFIIITVFGKCKMHETAALFVNHLPTSNFSSS